MTAVAGTNVRHRAGQGLLGAAVVVVAVGLARLSATAPEVAFVAILVTVVLAVLLPRPLLATTVLAATFFYDDYFTERFGFWNPGKLMGIVAVAALGISFVRDRRPIVWSPQVVIIAALAGSIGLSYTFARDPNVAAQTAVRYVLFFGLFFVVLQTVRERRDVHLVMDVLLGAGWLAAMYGLDNFLFHGWDRAGGPLADPGDFGLQLATVVPFAVYRIGSTTGWARLPAAVALATFLAAILASFSRASLVGLAVAGAWAVVTGRVPVRVALAAGAMAGAIVLGALQTRPDTIETTLQLKQNIAQQNVDNRFALWGVAVDEWMSAPLLGVGPGNFEVRFAEFESPFRQRIETTHNAYLNVLAELGGLGFTLFGAYMAASWWEIRSSPGTGTDPMRTAIAAGFIIAAAGALFMTQQFYPPLWFLGALGAALNRAEPSPSTQGRRS